MTHFFRVTTFLIGLGLAVAGGSAAEAAADHPKLAQDALNKVLRPGYEAFATDAKALKEKTAALCAAPSEAGLQDARSAFAAAVKGWSAVEIYQFGPVNREHRYERLFFWPDRKGLGLRQVQRAISSKDDSVTSAKTLGQKSVALQGLPALEYLLYGNGAEALAKPDDAGAFRCRFAAAVADNIATLAQEVAGAWEPDAPFTKVFLEPGPDDPLYLDPKDVTLELYKAFSGGIERVRDEKLGRALGESVERARPRIMPFWQSGQTFPNMAGNIEAVRKLFVDADFAEIVAGESPGVQDSVLFDLDRVARLLAEEQSPIAEAVTDPDQREKLEALRVGLHSARETASELIAQGAGLNFGFNAGDGD